MDKVIARGNSLGGISDAARNVSVSSPACAGIHVKTGLGSTDIIVEGNDFSCPAPGLMNTSGVFVEGGAPGCKHCKILQ